MKRNRHWLTSLIALLCCFALVLPLAGCDPEDTANPSSDPSEETSIAPGPLPVEDGKVSVTGTQAGFVEYGGKYYTDFATLDEERAAAKMVNIQVAEEGFVLLKNDNCLPLGENELNVSMFGYKTANIMMGGGGSGSGRPGQYGVPMTTLQMGMEEAGFRVNQRLLSFYSSKSAEVKPEDIPESITYTYGSYNDAALVMVSRSGSEGSDEKTFGYEPDQNADENAHMLELTDVEKSLIRYVKERFDKVILIVNSSNAMELGEVNEAKTDSNLGVDAILWVGHTGNDGAAAIGRILNGSVCPSGRTADTYAVDFTQDPTFTNFGSNAQNLEADGSRMDNNIYVGDTATDYHSVEYREGIYVGYRYYETKGHDAGDEWYKANVVYPFGYGLSYTTFTQEFDGVAETGEITDPASIITVRVKVTNTGDMAGKDVVQLYYTAPYTEAGIEKAHVNLGAFAKTNLLQPGESEVVTLQLVAQDMASFDWNDANDNGFRGYELEAGDYVLSIRSNAHDEIASITRTIPSDIQCTTDYTTGAEIRSLFGGDEGLEDYKSTNDTLENNLMSRGSGLELPAPLNREERTWSQVEVDELDSQKTFFSCDDTEEDPWYVSQVPSTWTQNKGERDEDGKTAIQLADLMGLSYTEPTMVGGVATAATDEGTQKWDEYMNQLTWEELTTIVSYGGFGQPGVETIGKKQNGAYDAAAHPFWNGGMFGGAQPPEDQMGTNWVTPAVWGCTWNVDLLRQIGVMTGNEALFFNVNGLYGFSTNIHRSPFGGRNFEYLSEDGLLSGKLLAALCKACTEKGLVTYTKHFMMNNQETNRNTNGGVMTWATEQAIREIYAKPYEIAVKEGNNSAFMTAFNRIGKSTCSDNYALLELLTRDEWGFCGHNVTDYMDYAEYRYTNLMTRAGNELPLGGMNKLIGKGKGGDSSSTEGTWSAEQNTVLVAPNAADAAAANDLRKAGDNAGASAYETVPSATQWFNVRKAAQRVLYSNANSNAILNGYAYQLNKELTYTAGEMVGSVSFFGSRGEQILKTDFDAVSPDVCDVKIVEMDEIPGMTVNEAGEIMGTPTTPGDYVIQAKGTLDGWVYCRLTITVHIV